MAISKILEATTLSIEVEKGVDQSGNTVYGKRTFSGIKNNSDIEKVNAVAEGISTVLNENTRYFYLTETSKLQ